jgi:ABC-type transport system involved in multi-copper enzyme maturation permease subunit
MLHLIYIEYLKLRGDRAFLLLMGLFVLSIVGANCMAAAMSEEGHVLSGFVDFSFPKGWMWTTYISSFLLVVPCLVVVMHTCSEYTYRTHRQNVIDGLSRTRYISAKLLVVTVISLFTTVLVFLTALLLGLVREEPLTFTGVEHVGYFLVQSMMYVSVAFLFALLFKKSALAIGLFCFYAFIIETILERVLNRIHYIGELLPLASSDHLLAPAGLMRAARMEAHWSPTVYLISSLVFLSLCFFVCYCRYKRQDL